MVHERLWEKRHFSSLSLSTTRVRQRLCNLMGTDVIRLNDKRYFQKLSDRLQEEYETVMDKEEEARAASENERLRRLMLEGVIKNPHDYRAIIHGEHHKHKHSKKKKRRSKRKKQVEPEREIEEGSATTLTPQASEEESESQEQKDEVVTQVEILSRPGSSLASRAVSRDKRVSSARTRRSPSGGRSRTEESRLVEEQGEEEENDQEKRFSEMHVPPPHRPSSSCSLRRKRLKSASARVSHWDESRESEESSEEETEEETRSLPDTRRSKNYWKYSKTEKPLVLTLRREETVEGLYSIAEQLISPKKAEESYDKKGKRAY